STLFDIDGAGPGGFLAVNLLAQNFTAGTIGVIRRAVVNVQGLAPNQIMIGPTAVPDPLLGFSLGEAVSSGAASGFAPIAEAMSASFSSFFGMPMTNQAGDWVNSSSRFAGFRFQQGANTHFGWLRLHIDVNLSTNPAVPFARAEATVVDWAWEDTPGTPILAGDTGLIPEPSSLGLLALGAMGVMAHRRRKRA
ncbi:MAG: PEP-CTERM sorting domain-containing protein, partial [Verrucomicrobiota bacterium]